MNPLMLSVFLTLPTHLLSLCILSGDNKRVNAWWIQAESLSLWVLCWCARAPVLWLTSVLHSASHSLHMSSTAPFSIQANVRGGWLHSHMPCRVWPVGWAALSKCAASVIGSRRTRPSSHWRVTRGTGGTRCPICALLHLAAVFLSVPAKSIIAYSPSSLHLLPHMHSGQGSAASVAALIDGNRNSSANRPIVWLTGDR